MHFRLLLQEVAQSDLLVVFSVVMQGALRDDTINGCVTYQGEGSH